MNSCLKKFGIDQVQRPKGVPENYGAMLCKNGVGIKFVDPKSNYTYIRVMPGKPHAIHKSQRRTYVEQKINGHTIDKYGNRVENPKKASEEQCLEFHIPFKEFVYRNRIKG